MGGHIRHLANTTEPSVCGGDAVLYQITLTTCYYKPNTRSKWRDAYKHAHLYRSASKQSLRLATGWLTPFDRVHFSYRHIPELMSGVNSTD